MEAYMLLCARIPAVTPTRRILLNGPFARCGATLFLKTLTFVFRKLVLKKDLQLLGKAFRGNEIACCAKKKTYSTRSGTRR